MDTRSQRRGFSANEILHNMNTCSFSIVSILCQGCRFRLKKGAVRAKMVLNRLANYGLVRLSEARLSGRKYSVYNPAAHRSDGIVKNQKPVSAFRTTGSRGGLENLSEEVTPKAASARGDQNTVRCHI